MWVRRSPVRVQLDSLPAGRAHLGHDKENQEARGAAVLSRAPGGKRSSSRQLHKASAQDEGCTASTHIRAHTNTEMRTRTFGFCVQFGVFLLSHGKGRLRQSSLGSGATGATSGSQRKRENRNFFSCLIKVRDGTNPLHSGLTPPLTNEWPAAPTGAGPRNFWTNWVREGRS